MRLIISLCFLLAATNSFSMEVAITNTTTECAGVVAKMARPYYPADALRTGKVGKAIIAVWLDSCGRVVNAEVFKSSGNKLLNSAALDSAKKSIYEPPKIGDAIPFRKEVPYSFIADTKKDIKVEKVTWPSSHKQAYFVIDETPSEFSTVEAAYKAITEEPHRLIGKQPLQDVRQLKNEQAYVWLFLADNTTYKFKVAARYQPIQAEKPTVAVQVLCDPSIIDCGKMKATLLKTGLLPFAKSLNE